MIGYLKTKLSSYYRYGLLAVSLILFIYGTVELHKPSCADAQNCYSITPEVQYTITGNRSDFSNCRGNDLCACSYVETPYPFTVPLTAGRYDAALTGFLAYYQSGDQDMGGEYVTITNVVPTGSNRLRIYYNLCLWRDSSNEARSYEIGFVAYAWE